MTSITDVNLIPQSPHSLNQAIDADITNHPGLIPSLIQTYKPSQSLANPRSNPCQSLPISAIPRQSQPIPANHSPIPAAIPANSSNQSLPFPTNPLWACVWSLQISCTFCFGSFAFCPKTRAPVTSVTCVMTEFLGTCPGIQNDAQDARIHGIGGSGFAGDEITGMLFWGTLRLTATSQVKP